MSEIELLTLVRDTEQQYRDTEYEKYNNGKIHYTATI